MTKRAAAPAPAARQRTPPTEPHTLGGSTVDGTLVHRTDGEVTGPTYEGQPAPPPVLAPLPKDAPAAPAEE